MVIDRILEKIASRPHVFVIEPGLKRMPWPKNDANEGCNYRDDGFIVKNGKRLGYWYGSIRSQTDSNDWIIRRDRLNTPSVVEAVRWRMLVHFEKVRQEWHEITDKIRARGRRGCRFVQKNGYVMEFISDTAGGIIRRPVEGRDGAIDKLAVLADPEGVTLAQRFDYLQTRSRQHTSRLQRIESLLFELLNLGNWLPYRHSKQTSITYTFRINGRLYHYRDHWTSRNGSPEALRGPSPADVLIEVP